MAPPKDIARSYPKRGLTADVGFRSEPKFCGDGSVKLDGSTQGATSATSYSVAASGAKTTLACWVNPRDLSGSNRTMVGNCVNNSTDNMALYQTGNNEMDAIILYGSGLSFKFAAKNLDENRWYFLAATFDYDATTFKFYVDGVEFSDTPSLGYGGTAGLFEIGFRDDSGGDIQHVNANLAHVMMIEDVLTQSEVVELMRDTSYAKAQTFGTVNRYYVLDADFNDSTGSHNATSVGSPSFTVDRPQLPRGLDLARGAAMARVYTGRAVDFDGAADYLRNSATVPSITGAGAQASICAWVNFDSASGGLRNIASFCNTANDDGIVIYQNNAEIGVAVFNNAPTVREKALTSVSTGRWFFVVGTWDKDTASQKVYVDGVRGSGNMSSGIGIEAGADIGARSSATPQYYFDGKIVGVKYFDVELTQAQIRELYHNPEQVLPTGVSASNLRRYYPLSDYNDTGGTGGRYFQDMGADGEPAEDLGSALMTFAQPVPCPQLGLQQSATRVYFENNYTRADATLGAAPGTTCTMSAWIMVENTGNYQYIFTLGTTIGATAWFGIAKNRPDNKLYTLQGSAIAAESSLQLSGYGEWNHVVVMTKSTAPYVRIFINNVEDTSINNISMGAYNLTNTSVFIGSNPVAANHMQGFANDCAIWDVELSDPEVAALYNSGVQGMDVSTVQSSNLKGWWKCDDLTTFKDYSGNGVNATLTASVNAASFPENASGSTIVGDFSMKRKGVSVLNIPASTTNEQAIIPANQDVYPSFANGGSLSLFFRLEKLGTTSTIFINSGYGTTHERFAVYAISSNKIQFELGDGVSDRANPQTTGTISDSDWHHFAMTVDYGGGSTTTIKLFLDGALDSTSTATTLAGVPNASALELLNRGAGNEGKGPLACFKSYQVTLSDNEIKQVYNSDLRLIKGLANE